MKKFTVYIAVFVGLFILTANAVSLCSIYFLRKGNMYKPTWLINSFNSSKKFDYIILGNSTGLTTINSKQIDSITDWNGINLSEDDTSPSTHYLMLQHFLKNKFETRKLILTVTSWGAHDTSSIAMSNNDYRHLPYIFNDYSYNYFSKREKGLKVITNSRYFPFAGISYYNQKLFFPSLISAIKPNYRNRFDEKGNYQYPPNINKLKPSDKPDTVYFTINNPDIMNIENLCQKHNIELIYYITPIRKSIIISDSLFNNRIIINHSNLLQNHTDYFVDDVHVDFLGRDVCTKELAKILKE